MARRGLSGVSSEVLAIDEARRAKITAAEAAQAERNAASKEVGAAKAKGDEAEFERLRALVAKKKDEIARLEDEAKAEDTRLRDLLLGLPNAPYDDVPDGADEDDNLEIHRRGEVPSFDFTARRAFRHPRRQTRHGFRDRRQTLRQPLRPVCAVPSPASTAPSRR